MEILLVGGSRHVGTFLTPYLSREHKIRVLDLHDPQHEVELVRGSINDSWVLKEVLSGVDAFVTMVIQGRQDGGEHLDHKRASARAALLSLGMRCADGRPQRLRLDQALLRRDLSLLRTRTRYGP